MICCGKKPDRIIRCKNVSLKVVVRFFQTGGTCCAIIDVSTFLNVPELILFDHSFILQQKSIATSESSVYI